MAFDYLMLILKFMPAIGSFALLLLQRRITSTLHRWNYTPLPAGQCKNVVVVGGSFAGASLARRLAHAVPTGFRVVLVEEKSHFNYSFAFPRFSVVGGHEKKAFIPYDGIKNESPEGAFTHVRDRATALGDGVVELASGGKIEYEYLALATGAALSPPAKLLASGKQNACEELQAMQAAIRAVERIAVVGGGAVGVQLATDIKSYYPGKSVTLIHSHERLLSRFGPKLHVYVMGVAKEMGLNVILNERPELPADPGLGFILSETLLNFKSTEETQRFDLVVCHFPAAREFRELQLTDMP